MNKLFPILFLVSLLFGQALDSRYHTTEEIYSLLDSLNQLEELEDWFHLDTIGYSTQENIPILAVRISDNANIKEDEPRVLFVGQVHAEEILGIEVVLELMNDLLFPDASIYTHMNTLKQYLDIWIIPTANPEGLNVVHEGLDFSFRKNKRDLSPDGPQPNGIFDYDPSIGNDVDGVDLNRNFSFNWTFGDTFLEPDNSDYASHYDYYKGEEPFSESEAIAIRDLALDNDFVFSIVWHSSRSGNLSEKVFTSWKWDEVKESPDLGIMKSIADQFAGGMNTEDGTSTYLSVFSGSRNGKLHDWFYRETGCFQYLVECGTANLQPDSLLIEDNIDRTKPAMVYLMDRAIGYYTDAAQITGIIFDEATGLPIEGAVVEVLEHSGSVLKPRLTNEFGRYRRILDVGTYTISIKADGYQKQEIVTVANNSSITTHDVYLQTSPLRTLKLILNFESDPLDIMGTISNDFGIDTLLFSSESDGSSFLLGEGIYSISLPAEFDWIPYEKTIELNQDITITIPVASGSPLSLSDSWPWESSEGPWEYDNETLVSQENILYDNGDSTLNSQWMESELIDVAGKNRVVVAVSHRFETEWDHDPITISILDENNLLLGEKSWTGDSWSNFQENYVSAVSETEFSNIKVRLKFSPDQTVNYRGWEIQDMTVYSIIDEYLEVSELVNNSFPKIPMKINSIYPNPSNGKFQMDLVNYPGGQIKVRIFNILGQELLSQTYQNLIGSRQFIDLDLNNIKGRPTSSGMVFVQVETLKEQAVKKCIILKD